MPITTDCPKCGRTIDSIPDEYAGKSGKCPGCKEKFTIPEATADPAPLKRIKKPSAASIKPRQSVLVAAFLNSIMGLFAYIGGAIYIALIAVGKPSGPQFIWMATVAVSCFASGFVLSGIAVGLRMLQAIYDETVPKE